MIVEICANSYASAKLAKEVGAGRIELCQNLMVGGLTPSAATIIGCIDTLALPTNVLIRPRSGDFCYSEDELMLSGRDITFCKEKKASGVVVGTLLEDGVINYEVCAHFKELAGDMDITFHRAFDFVPDPFGALDTLIELGYDRVLTSGQAANAFEGRQLLKELVQYAGDKITILAGGGINTQNVLPLIEATGLKEIHFSAKILKNSKATYASKLPLNSSSFPEHDYYESGETQLRKMMHLLT